MLAQCASLSEALERISSTLGRCVTEDAIEKRFARRGLKSPRAYLRCETEAKCLETVLVIPDCHIPFEDKRAWELMMKAARKLRPDTIVTLGDFADFLSVSSHDRRPDQCIQLQAEVDAVNARLDELDALGASRKEFLEGNHCERLRRVLKKQAMSLYDSLRVEDLFRLEERGWNFTPYREHVKVGKVFFTHDTGSAGATAHMKSGAAFEASCIQGHTHRAAVNYFGNVHGSTHVAAVCGWLGSIEAADYMHKVKTKDWALAFGVGYLEPNGNMHFQLVPIIDYKCVVGGMLVQ